MFRLRRIQGSGNVSMIGVLILWFPILRSLALFPVWESSDLQVQVWIQALSQVWMRSATINQTVAPISSVRLQTQNKGHDINSHWGKNAMIGCILTSPPWIILPLLNIREQPFQKCLLAKLAGNLSNITCSFGGQRINILSINGIRSPRSWSKLWARWGLEALLDFSLLSTTLAWNIFIAFGTLQQPVSSAMGVTDFSASTVASCC